LRLDFILFDPVSLKQLKISQAGNKLEQIFAPVINFLACWSKQTYTPRTCVVFLY